MTLKRALILVLLLLDIFAISVFIWRIYYYSPNIGDEHYDIIIQDEIPKIKVIEI